MGGLRFTHSAFFGVISAVSSASLSYVQPKPSAPLAVCVVGFFGRNVFNHFTTEEK